MNSWLMPSESSDSWVDRKHCPSFIQCFPGALLADTGEEWNKFLADKMRKEGLKLYLALVALILGEKSTFIWLSLDRHDIYIWNIFLSVWLFYKIILPVKMLPQESLENTCTYEIHDASWNYCSYLISPFFLELSPISWRSICNQYTDKIENYILEVYLFIYYLLIFLSFFCFLSILILVLEIRVMGQKIKCLLLSWSLTYNWRLYIYNFQLWWYLWKKRKDCRFLWGRDKYIVCFGEEGVRKNVCSLL